MGAQVVFVLIFIGFIIQTIDSKRDRFPVPIALLVVGIGLAYVPFFQGIALTKELIFDWFLPSLLFISSYQFPFKEFKRYASVIFTLGTVGILLSAFLLAALMYLFGAHVLSLSFVGFLLLAVILTPTDPVSVVSVLQDALSSRKVTDVVEGESLVNDGTSIVLFAVVLSLYKQDEGLRLSDLFLTFSGVIAGGIAVGIFLGWIVHKAIHLLHQREYQILLSLFLAYFSFYLAELLHVSGVLATVSAGLYLSAVLNESREEKAFRLYLDGFWSVIELVILSLIFLLVGIEATKYNYMPYLFFIVIVFVLSVIVRYVVLSVLIKSVGKWKALFSWQDIVLTNWAGIKGTMSLALILGFSVSTPREEAIVIVAFGVVLLSLLVQSLTLYPLAKRMR